MKYSYWEHRRCAIRRFGLCSWRATIDDLQAIANELKRTRSCKIEIDNETKLRLGLVEIAPSVSTIQGVVNGYLSAATVYTANATVNVSYATPLSTYTSCSSTTGFPGAPGTAVTVSVSHPYNPLTGCSL
jgi:hypothetical protein